MSIDLKNEFTKVPNILLEKLASSKLNGTQLRILNIVIRYTYGFHMDSHELGAAFIATSLKSGKRLIQKEIKILVELNVLQIVKSETALTGRYLSINNNYEEWGGAVDTLCINNDTVYHSEHTECSNQYTGECINQTPNKEKLNKNINKNNIEKKYGEYKNVLLTNEEYKLLQDKFPDCQDKIEHFSYWIELKGYKYKSHYLAILKWSKKDSQKKKEETNPYVKYGRTI